MTPALLVLLQVLALPVGAVPLSEVAFSPTQDAPARAVARNQSRLSSEITAVVREVPVQVGDRVARGAPLVELDCRPFRIAARRAAAEVAALEVEADLAKRRLERARRLRDSETVSEELLDSRAGESAAVAARLLGARAAQDGARLDVERCTVSAPFGGVVTARSAQVGELTAPGAPLVTLVQLQGSEVAAQLSPEQATMLLEGAQDLRFAWAGGEVPVRLRSLLPVVEPESRSREARLEPLAEAAPPGTAGRLVWERRGLAVPAHLLVRRDGRLGVFVIEAGAGANGSGLRARFHVLAGAEEGRPARIDLPGATRLVTEGRLSLRDGDEVKLR